MGGVISNGKDNDDLIDILVEADYLKTPSLQRIFRAVDRGDYYTDAQKESAYRDVAWRSGNLHLSSPCVYSEVMETLKLKPGQSFLNIGSGSGYLSTLAGLILGPYGINHGIEIFSDVVNFANGKLVEFVDESEAVDAFEFCVPTFQVGNCLNIGSNSQLYDKVYCGASCPQEHEVYMKNLIKVGGVLVMPLKNKLLRITRTSETTWDHINVLSVSFAPLLCPDEKGPPKYLKLPDFTPPSLQEICRSLIRTTLRNIIETDYPSIKNKRKNEIRNRTRTEVRSIVIPFVDPDDSGADMSSDDSNSRSNTDSDDNDADYISRFTINSNLLSETTVFIQNFMQRRLESQDDEPGPSRSRANDKPGPSRSRANDNNDDGKKSEPEKRSRPREEDSDSDWNVGSNDDNTVCDNSPAPRSVKRRRRLQHRLSRVVVKRQKSCPKLKLESRTATFVWKQVLDDPSRPPRQKKLKIANRTEVKAPKENESKNPKGEESKAPKRKRSKALKGKDPKTLKQEELQIPQEDECETLKKEEPMVSKEELENSNEETKISNEESRICKEESKICKEEPKIQKEEPKIPKEEPKLQKEGPKISLEEGPKISLEEGPKISLEEGPMTSKKAGAMSSKKPGPMSSKKAVPMTSKKPGPMSSKKVVPMTSKKPGPMTSNKPGSMTSKKPGPMTSKKAGPMTSKKAGPKFSEKEGPKVSKREESKTPKGEESKISNEENQKNINENYKNLMLKKILSLPLPLPLRKYINYGRNNI